MVWDIVREAPFGQAVRFFTGNRFFKYPEELDGFEVPKCYDATAEKEADIAGLSEKSKSTRAPSQSDDGDNPGLIPVNTHRESDVDVERRASAALTRTNTIPYTEERFEAEQAAGLEKTKSSPIKAQKTSDGTILVDWYTTDDQTNPQNWSSSKKAFVALEICLYTFVVYCGSAIYVSSIPGVMAKFGVGETKASLGLAMYVIAYGVGPLLWSPMSEIPIFGRNIPYVTTFAVFVILAVPTALVDNYAGLLVLRFLQGFFGSPCLANGGASMQDMYSLLYLPYLLAFWVSASYCGPALGPMLSGYAVTAKGWRWGLWEILWMSGPVFILWFFFLPETSAGNILLRRAQRLRAATGNNMIQSQTEIDSRGKKFSSIFVDAIIKPIEIMLKDPAVLFTNVYTSLIYGIYYSFFEVFPLVYPPMYGFNLGETGTTFVCIVVACVIAIAIYDAYLYFYMVPDILKNGLRAPESRLVPALFAVSVPTIGLFLFGWTANPKIHWISSVIGITLYAGAVFILLQYAASLFAGNDFCRSAFAFGSILYARPMYINLGVAEGVSLLAGLSVLGIIGMFTLYIFGGTLRARSKFAVS
ncbi:MAG: hypothetical protein M1814_001030 [Vezdaea aestivalis]|nr:MAG: hypothetical protein M1814_001030 [Vezdaea aestivalis]